MAHLGRARDSIRLIRMRFLAEWKSEFVITFYRSNEYEIRGAFFSMIAPGVETVPIAFFRNQVAKPCLTLKLAILIGFQVRKKPTFIFLLMTFRTFFSNTICFFSWLNFKVKPQSKSYVYLCTKALRKFPRIKIILL